MFEAAGDLGFEQKPGSTGLVVGVAIEDLLERHLAIQLGIERDEHRPEAACVRVVAARGSARPARLRRPGKWVPATIPRGTCVRVELRQGGGELRVCRRGSGSRVALPLSVMALRLFSTLPPWMLERALEASASIRALLSSSMAP